MKPVAVCALTLILAVLGCELIYVVSDWWFASAPVPPRPPVGLTVTLMPPGPPPVPDNLSYEVRAIEHVRPITERDHFELNTARCWWEGDYALCGLCFTDLNRSRRLLGAALVKCDAKRCYWPLDGSEHERVGWNGEPECFAEDWREE